MNLDLWTLDLDALEDDFHQQFLNQDVRELQLEYLVDPREERIKNE
jgi:hypothetical protein